MSWFWLLSYCTVFAVTYALAVVWMLERKDKKYGLGTFSFADAFPAGSFFLILVYISNIFVLLRLPDLALFYNAALLAGLAVWAARREAAYRAFHRRAGRRLRAEARLLERYLKKDPANAAYLERLSEIHEKLGKKGKALEAARRAAALDPSAGNAWRLKQLEEENLPGGQRGGKPA